MNSAVGTGNHVRVQLKASGSCVTGRRSRASLGKPRRQGPRPTATLLSVLVHLLNTIAPVFLVVLAGYVAARRALFDAPTVDALMRYAVRFAIPCLLFRAVSTIDLGAAYDGRSLVSFYAPALLCFAGGTLVARRVFGRRPGEAVAVGFGGLFSNLVLLGLPVIGLSFGEAALPKAYALVSVHSPFCYLLGIVTMELARADGRAPSETARVVVHAMLGNALMIGIGLGFLFNLSTLSLPLFAATALDLVADSGLPIALVGLGGVIARYSLAERLAEPAAIAAISLVLHPALALASCALLGVPAADRDVVVLMAAMSPGVNVYLFANLYDRAEGTAAATVLLGTIAAAGSIGAWSWVLRGI